MMNIKKRNLILFLMLSFVGWGQSISDIRSFLRGLEIEFGYSRVTMIPLLQLNWAALLELANEEYEGPSFIFSEDRAWASMGTYFWQFLNADPNEMNFPALNASIRHQNDNVMSYVQIVTNPFFSLNQRLFYLYGKTGVDYLDNLGPEDTIKNSWGIYAHVSMIGAEDVNLLGKFFIHHFWGSPDIEVLNYGLGYVVAGSGFHYTLGIGDENFVFKMRPYFELSAFLPFTPTAELGLDFGFEALLVQDLTFYFDVKMIKSIWQTAGVNLGIRYHFRRLAEMLEVFDSETESEPNDSNNRTGTINTRNINAPDNNQNDQADSQPREKPLPDEGKKRR